MSCQIADAPLRSAKGHFPGLNTAPTWVLVKGDNTPLHWASMRGHVEIVKYLLHHSADRGIRNKQDKIPIDLCQPCWSDAYRYTRQVSMLQVSLVIASCSDIQLPSGHDACTLPGASLVSE